MIDPKFHLVRVPCHDLQIETCKFTLLLGTSTIQFANIFSNYTMKLKLKYHLDTALSRENKAYCLFIDVEGYEVNVLHGIRMYCEISLKMI